MKLVLLLVAAAFLPAALCADDLSASYRYSSVLFDQGDDRYELYWSFDRGAETIEFAVKVKTTGWVGFGLSPSGMMPGSDVVIGWVDASGTPFLNDRYADEKAIPPVDLNQNWDLVSGREEDGYTILEFKRDWVTCDDRDRDIDAQTARLVFSWNDADPANNDPLSAVYHDQRGTMSVNLLGGLEAVPSDPADLESFALLVNNVTIPNSDTTYWCEVFELPAEIQSQTRYITKFAPTITDNTFTYVHHVLIYLCSSDLDESFVGASAPCFEAGFPSFARNCLQQELLAVWAVGGEAFYYPENVAYPIGGPGKPRHAVIQMHYDNPDRNTGIFDSSGLEFFYTSTPREFDAGILTVGDKVGINEVIPPKAVDYKIIGLCSSNCTEQYLPDEGIKIFANLLHTHLVGHGVVLRHLRENDTCGGYQELKPIDKNLQYDFNYQQFNILPEEVTVLPGDSLILECLYSTDGVRSGVTLGGTSTREEMCLSFPVYYPRTTLSLCESIVTPTAYTPFVADITDMAVQTAIIGASIQENGTALKVALDKLPWTEEQIQQLQSAVTTGPLEIVCTDEQGNEVDEQEENVPVVTCPYEEPVVCVNRTGGINPTPGGINPTPTPGGINPTPTPGVDPEICVGVCDTGGAVATAAVTSSLVLGLLTFLALH